VIKHSFFYRRRDRSYNMLAVLEIISYRFDVLTYDIVLIEIRSGRDRKIEEIERVERGGRRK
jgi:hypothetical protein